MKSKKIFNSMEYYASKEAFEVYKRIYESSSFINEFDLDNPLTWDERNGKDTPKDAVVRYNAYLKNDSTLVEKIGKEFKVSEDCLFNFNSKKTSILKELIKQDYAAAERVISKLEKCSEMHHSEKNIVLLPATGGMNNLKGKLWFDASSNVCGPDGQWHIALDRPNTLVYCLDRYYKYGDELVLACSTKTNYGCIKKFLDIAGDVYAFCKEFLLLDRDAVDILIKSGGKPINDIESLEFYVDAALNYWENYR